jgi:hypothetical protein
MLEVSISISSQTSLENCNTVRTREPIVRNVVEKFYSTLVIQGGNTILQNFNAPGLLYIPQCPEMQ